MRARCSRWPGRKRRRLLRPARPVRSLELDHDDARRLRPGVVADLGLRASARSQSNRIARIAIKSGLKTLVFAQSRLMVEVLTKYLKDIFDHDPRKPPRIRAYRGGYLPTERRAAERDMRAGNIDGIISTSALELGVTLRFEGAGVDEIAVVSAISGDKAPALKVGDVIVKVDPRYFRPAEVETLLGDPSKAKAKLGWSPKTTLAELVKEMVISDYTSAKRDNLVKQAGFQAYDYHE